MPSFWAFACSTQRPPQRTLDMLSLNQMIGFGAAPSGESDPQWANVSLLLHLDGTNGSTTVTDSKGLCSPTCTGNAQISTAQSKFGGASALFDGTGDYISMPSNTGLQLGSGDFTVELFVYITSNPASSKAIISKRSNTGGYGEWAIGVDSSGRAFLYLTNVNNNWPIANATVGTLSTNAWNHLGFSRSGSTIYAHMNGTTTSLSTTFTGTVYDTGTALYLASEYNQAAWGQLAGYIDEVRITKGFCRYTGNYTVPTTAFPNA